MSVVLPDKLSKETLFLLDFANKTVGILVRVAGKNLMHLIKISFASDTSH